MMTRSTVGRFLILAVLLVSLGVIAQAALIITKGTGKAVAKGNVGPSVAPVAVAASTPQPAASPTPASADAAATPPVGETAPVRVVYPGPLGDTPIQAHKFAGAAPSMPLPAPSTSVAPLPTAASPAPVAPPAPPVAPAPPIVAAAAPPPAKPAPVVVAAAEPDAPPVAADPAPAGKGGIDLNSASVDALNHLGGGHIGQSIVKHRPYTSVADLMKKRVIRRSVYDQIKDQVAAQ